jgi:hypothetical protein
MKEKRVFRVQVWYAIGTAGDYVDATDFNDAFKKGCKRFENYDYGQIAIERMPKNFKMPVSRIKCSYHSI